MSAGFCRPKNKNPTRHLFVGNCGPSVGIDEAQALAIFSPFGAPSVSIPDPARSHLFVSYPTAEQASNALEALNQVACPGGAGRSLVIKFADVPRESRPMQIEEVYIHTTSDECGVPGLQLIEDFLSEEEEDRLLSMWESQEQCEQHGGRKVKHFGVRFNYVTRNVDRENPMKDFPDLVKSVALRIQAAGDVPALDQLTVNDYPPGVGLAPHIDTHSAFTGSIVSLSMGAGAIMEFRKNGDRRRIQLLRRSLLIMGGESRYCWQHYIPHRRLEGEENHRVSFTFRMARGAPCDCPYPEFCDSQDGSLPPTRLAAQQQQDPTSNSSHVGMEHTTEANDEACSSMVTKEPEDNSSALDAQGLEDEYVHKVYDVIARHFSATRFAIWPKVREFLEWFPTGSLLADVGCGNGKYFGVRKDILVTGLDRSAGLVDVALSRIYPAGLPTSGRPVVDVGVADCLTLPLRTSSYDGVLCIAVLHHISNPCRRAAVLKEISRILIMKSRALVTVWAEEQENPTKTIAKWTPISDSPGQGDGQSVDSSKKSKEGKDFFVPWHLPLHRAEGQDAANKIRQSLPSHIDPSEDPADDGNQANQSGPNGVRHGEVDTEKRTVVFQRYYHLFEKGELENLCNEIEGLVVVESFYDKSNWCVVVERT